MADFDLLQTDAQVQSILNDGQNMQGAGAQTTLTTESVLLKDVNGNYHKILKSYFTEAIRDTLADLLVNNDKGTTINQIAAIASGDFGSITPANLASVLGAINGVSWRPDTYDGYINDLSTPGFVYFSAKSDDTGLPYQAASTSNWWWCLTFGRGDLTQIVWNNSAIQAINIRRGGKKDVAWTGTGSQAWKGLYGEEQLEGKSQLTSLASALSVINDSFYGSDFNLDEFNMSGIFFLAKAKCENAPSSANDGIFISHIGNKAFQIWISTALSSTYGIFIRAKNTSWGAWYRFNLTS